MTIYDFLFRLVEEHPGFSFLCVVFIGIPYVVLMWPLISPRWREKRRLAGERHEAIPLDTEARLEHVKGELGHIKEELNDIQRHGPMPVVTRLDAIKVQLDSVILMLREK